MGVDCTGGIEVSCRADLSASNETKEKQGAKCDYTNL